LVSVTFLAALVFPTVSEASVKEAGEAVSGPTCGRVCSAACSIAVPSLGADHGSSRGYRLPQRSYSYKPSQ
jgi:hypothetical protein